MLHLLCGVQKRVSANVSSKKKLVLYFALSLPKQTRRGSSRKLNRPKKPYSSPFIPHRRTRRVVAMRMRARIERSLVLG